MFSKFASRKFLVTLFSNIFSGFLLTQGIEVDSAIVDEAANGVSNAESIASAGSVLLNLGIVVGQAWINGRYLKGQALVDAAEKAPQSSASLR